MKVSQIPYKRIDKDDAERRINEAVALAKNAVSVDELLASREHINKLVDEFSTMFSLANMRFTLNTKDEFYQAERAYYDEITPIIGVKSLEFKKAFLGSPFLDDAKKQLNPLVIKMFEIELKTADERIVADLQEENRLTMQYVKFVSELLFDFKGEKITLGALKKHMTDSDRQVRKAAYNVLGATLQENSNFLDDIFDKMVKVRDTMAKKMGFENFIEMGYYRMSRTAFDENTIKTFRKNVKEQLVPVIAKLKNEIKERLGIDELKLYDNETYFENDPTPILDAQGILAAGQEMYRDMSKETGDFMDMMMQNDAFDVLPREGKWTGGYCTAFPLYNQPFIFANFNGTTADVDVITHEAGHAFAFYAHSPYQLTELEIGGMETAETHSMSMEFLCWKYMDKFFGERAKDYCYKHLFDSITFIPYGVIVDLFQHIIYENPQMTPKERKDVWLALEKEYRPHMNAQNITYLEEGTRWQYQNHIFELPFYYIDYCLAQSVALQVLMLSQKDYSKAFSTYLEHTKRGGLYDFNTLVKMMELKSPFEEGALEEVARGVEELLAKLAKE
ncbi:MAG: M3 family oligoendopeptidase [Clostridia bacterium]